MDFFVSFFFWKYFGIGLIIWHEFDCMWEYFHTFFDIM